MKGLHMSAPSPRILIVDDDARNVRVLEAMLRAEKYATMAAHNGREALDFATEHLPELILLDVMMPDMNGFEVIEKLKADPATQRIPVIMITALDDRESRLYALQAGADEFITKPVDRIELSVRVKNLLALRRYRQQQPERRPRP
jgi:putative two-component system response regulator